MIQGVHHLRGTCGENQGKLVQQKKEISSLQILKVIKQTWRAKKEAMTPATQTVTPRSYPATRSSSSCSNSSNNSNHSQLRKDEQTLPSQGVVKARIEEAETLRLKDSDSVTHSHAYSPSSTAFTSFDIKEHLHSNAKESPRKPKGPHYVPVYPQNLPDRPIVSFRAKPRVPDKPKKVFLNNENNNNRCDNNSNLNNNQTLGSSIVYAELQLPTSSNNGSMRRSNADSIANKTQYAEISFQPQPLQTAEI
ncbi:unnamed protein product [Meganyctiphanes norvegica]|uniref:Uncharacterized protein n=1 Tax=Meganyctiphanes norvegica TaxID=48144 RepID=A0AAV2RBT8_MEGNR